VKSLSTSRCDAQLRGGVFAFEKNIFSEEKCRKKSNKEEVPKSFVGGVEKELTTIVKERESAERISSKRRLSNFRHRGAWAAQNKRFQRGRNSELIQLYSPEGRFEGGED